MKVSAQIISAIANCGRAPYNLATA